MPKMKDIVRLIFRQINNKNYPNNLNKHNSILRFDSLFTEYNLVLIIMKRTYYKRMIHI